MKPRRSLSRFRYMNESVGAFILIIAVVALAALVQSARVQHWFDPGARLRVILPQKGLFGLTAGSEVHVLGTRAGSVESIVIEPDTGKILAEVRIQRQFVTFVRSDSGATIRRKLAVAGDSFLDISRGVEEPLDWDLAVIVATADAAPSDALNAILAKLEVKFIPALDHLDEAVVEIRDLARFANDPNAKFQALLSNAVSITGKVDEGQGTVGQLVNDDRLMQNAVAISEKINRSMDQIEPTLATLDKVMNDVSAVSGEVGERSEDIGRIIDHSRETLDALQTMLNDLQKASADLPRITHNAADASDSLPGLTVQAR